MDKDRDNLVILLAQIKDQERASTKSQVWQETYKRTKIKTLRLYERAQRERYANIKRRHVRVRPMQETTGTD